MKERILLLNENREEKIIEVRQEYPYGMKRVDYTLFSTPWHWHEEIEFVYIAKGSEEVTTSNYTYTIREGEAYFVNSNILNCKKKSDDAGETQEIVHLFHPILLGGSFRSVYQTKYLDPVLKNSGIEVVIFRNSTESGRKFIQKIQKLTSLYDRPDMEMETRNILSEMWLLLLREIRDNQSAEHTRGLQSQDRIRYMLSFINQHYREKFSMKELADSAGVSEREASRCFVKNVGRTPFDYLSQFRADRSRELLGKTDMSVTEIALDVGFADSSYYGKVFRKYFAMTPKEYRIRYSETSLKGDKT